MTIPAAELKALFRDSADDITDVVNPTPVALYFAPAHTTSTSTNFNSLSYDILGNPTPYDQLAPLQQGSQQIVEPVVQEITARIYWDPKEINAKIRDESSIKDLEDVCRMNAYTTDMAKIQGATYAVINGRKCVRFKDPVPYGMFGDKFYCISYWKVML